MVFSYVYQDTDVVTCYYLFICYWVLLKVLNQNTIKAAEDAEVTVVG